jgi:hypothetical protein
MPLKPSEIQASIQIADRDRAVPAKIVFRNISAEKAYLYKRLVPGGGRLKMNLFRISGASGVLRYRGLSVKFAAPTPGDFLELGPGATLDGSINLGDNYAFPPGAGTYRVRYLAANGFPQNNQLRQIESPEVTFELAP